MNTIAQQTTSTSVQIQVLYIKRMSVRKEEIRVLINGVEYFGYVITFAENFSKKYVQFLRKPQGKNQAKFELKYQLENYLNN
jgi:hypothetical protein